MQHQWLLGGDRLGSGELNIDRCYIMLTIVFSGDGIRHTELFCVEDRCWSVKYEFELM